MSITFEDLLLAKVLAEDNILSVKVLKGLARTVDERGGSIVDLAVNNGLIERMDQRLSNARIKMERYLFMMQDTMFADQAKKSGLVSKALIDQAKSSQKQEGFSRTIADILTRSLGLERRNLITINRLALPHMKRHRDSIIAKYREEDFAGIARPLTKRASKTDSMRIKKARSGSGRHRRSSEPSLNIVKADSKKPSSSRRIRRGTMAMAMPEDGEWSKGKKKKEEDPYIGRVIGDKYILKSRLGQGAMGMVYLAADDQGGPEYAVKLVLDAVKKQDIVKRFRREILATSFFDHENVVNIFDAGETSDGAFYMVLELINGQELSQILKKQGPLPTVRAIDLITQLLNGLAAAHSANVVHKDVKPENIMVIDNNGSDFVKLMDFGLARITDAEEFGDKIFRTMEGQVTGSPAYMAPEVVSGDDVGPHSDLYSVGISLFEMLTGKHPHEAKTVREYITAHLYKEPRKLKDVKPELELPDTVQDLIDLLLAKRPSMRPQTCAAVLTFIQDRIEPRLLA